MEGRLFINKEREKQTEKQIELENTMENAIIPIVLNEARIKRGLF